MLPVSLEYHIYSTLVSLHQSKAMDISGSERLAYKSLQNIQDSAWQKSNIMHHPSSNWTSHHILKALRFLITTRQLTFTTLLMNLYMEEWRTLRNKVQGNRKVPEYCSNQENSHQTILPLSSTCFSWMTSIPECYEKPWPVWLNPLHLPIWTPVLSIPINASTPPLPLMHIRTHTSEHQHTNKHCNSVFNLRK